MVVCRRLAHDGLMTEQPNAGAAEDTFDPNRLRTIGSIRRSRDDRMVAGVCAGAARYLRIDPVVLRVIIASLTFVGLAGLIIYVAAWLLLPEDDKEHGLIDGYLPESMDREQVRRLGLFLATAIACASALGAGFTFAVSALPFVGVVLVLFYLFVVRPYNRRQAQAVAAESSAAMTSTQPPDVEWPDADPSNDRLRATFTPAGTDTAPPPAPGSPEKPKKQRNPRRDYGALFGSTLAVLAITLGMMGLYSAEADHIAWPYYWLASLLVIGVGMLVGTFLGNGRPLALLGIPVAFVLLATTALPSFTIGGEHRYPGYASDVDDAYEQGIGDFVLDLTEVRDPSALDGRTVTVEQGVGSLEVIVPKGVDLDVHAKTNAGQLRILGEITSGAPVSRHYADPDSDGPDLRLNLEQTTGEIRVIHQ